MVFAVADGPVLAARANDFNLLQERSLFPEKPELLDLSVGVELNDVDLHNNQYLVTQLRIAWWQDVQLGR